MPRRSFVLLRKQAIDALEEMHKSSNPHQPFIRNTFSKHFWYDFKKAHPEIEELYQSIPLAKAKSNKDFQNSAKSEEFGDDVTIGLSSFDEEEKKSLSSPLGINNEENKLDWLNFSLSDQNFSLKNLLECTAFRANTEASESHNLDIESTEEEGRTPQSSYCNKDKMIIEPEENEDRKSVV